MEPQPQQGAIVVWEPQEAAIVALEDTWHDGLPELPEPKFQDVVWVCEHDKKRLLNRYQCRCYDVIRRLGLDSALKSRAHAEGKRRWLAAVAAYNEGGVDIE